MVAEQSLPSRIGHGRHQQHLARLRLDPAPVAGIVIHGCCDIANIDRADRPAGEQRTTEIEIPVLDERGILLARSADSVGCRGMATIVPAGISGAVIGPENHRPGQMPVGEVIGKAEKGSGHFLDAFVVAPQRATVWGGVVASAGSFATIRVLGNKMGLRR